MMLKEEVSFVVLIVCGVLAVATAAHHPRFCTNCEEEIWEEVPCKSLPPTVVTTTTVKPAITTPSTTAKYKNTAAVSGGAATPTTATASAYSTTPSRKPPHSFRQCYCECKMGCKEFCRKVFVHGKPDKDIKQVVHSCSNSNNGRIETKHSHECKFISTAAKNPKLYDNNGDHKESYDNRPYDVNVVDARPLPVISKGPPPPIPHQPYKNHEYFLDDVAKFLHQDDKQSGNLGYFPTGSGNEVPFYVNGEKIYANDAEPPKDKSNYILTKPSLLTKNNEPEFNAAIDNYLKDYSNLNAPQGNRAFQAAYSVSYQ